MPRIWEFTEQASKMPLTASIFLNVLQSSGFSSEERLVREALQNSVDAHRPGSVSPVSVRIESKLLPATINGKRMSNQVGPSKKSLVKAIGLRGEPFKRRKQFGLPDGNALHSIRDADEPLPTLIIADSHTHRLPGAWNGTDPNDHFGRLVVNLGVDDKAEAAEFSGGSYGFGKTVYAKASGIGVVVFYSVFAPDSSSENAHARFMATGLFKVHKFEDLSYTGFAFYGDRDSSASSEAIPITDEAAHDLAEACGLERRSPDDHGTSILIVDCDMDVDEMRAAAEKYWWPRLVRTELDVTFVDEGKESFPRPRKDTLLKPFIACAQNLTSGTSAPPKSKLYQFNRFQDVDGSKKKTGTLSCVALTETSVPSNQVALIRQPGMVVGYIAAGSDSFEECVGVFQADTDVEKILTYAEPQMHHEWDQNQDRLKLKFPEKGPFVVGSILRRIKVSLRDFQKMQEPPLPPEGLQAKDLAKLLGQFVNAPGPSGPTPPKVRRPVSIHVKEDRVKDGERARDTAEITLALREDFRDDTLKCTVTVQHEVLGDASERVVERTTCSLTDSAGEVIAKGSPAASQVTITKGTPLKLKVVAPSDVVYVTRMKVSVEQIL